MVRILIITDDDHLGVAIEAAQLVIQEEAGSAITITDAENAPEILEYNDYTHVVKNPTLLDIMELLKCH